jgi:hypothetical protein
VLGEIEHFLGDLHVLDFIEILIIVPDFVRVNIPAASCIAFFPFSRSHLEHNGRGRGFKSKRARADYGASPFD